MSSATRSLFALLAFSLVCLPLSAQKIQPGDIVVITDAAGMQLSAGSGQSLAFSPNKGGWEQWEVVGGGVLRSFHGTMMVNDMGPVHAPSRTSDPTLIRLAGVQWGTTQYGFADLVDGGECILEWMNGSLPFWWVSSRSRLVGYVSFMHQIPTGTSFRVHRVASPQAGRQPEKLAVLDRVKTGLRNAHGTYVGAMNPKIGETCPAEHAPTNTPGLHWDVTLAYRLTANAGDRFLRAGDPVSVIVDLKYGNMLAMRPSGKRTADGVETVNFVPGTEGGWTIVAPGFATGARLPAGSTILLRSPAGTYLSADPGRKGVQLSPNQSAWEQWTLAMP